MDELHLIQSGVLNTWFEIHHILNLWCQKLPTTPAASSSLAASGQPFWNVLASHQRADKGGESAVLPYITIAKTLVVLHQYCTGERVHAEMKVRLGSIRLCRYMHNQRCYD